MKYKIIFKLISKRAILWLSLLILISSCEKSNEEPTQAVSQISSGVEYKLNGFKYTRADFTARYIIDDSDPALRIEYFTFVIENQMHWFGSGLIRLQPLLLPIGDSLYFQNDASFVYFETDNSGSEKEYFPISGWVVYTVQDTTSMKFSARFQATLVDSTNTDTIRISDGILNMQPYTKLIIE